MTRARKIRILLWTYFWLLIFEGALRKWMLPGLSNPLLVVRDPICIMAIAIGWPYLLQTSVRPWLIVLGGIGALGFISALLAGHGDWVTAAFGTRVLLLHFPLIFLFAAVFTRDDLWAFARWTLVLSIPMTILIAMQYSLPSTHFINVAPGGDGTAGFSGALGKLRPPGTFSFISGLSSFYGLAAAFFAGWLAVGPRPLPKWLWIIAACLLFALPVSISRTLFFYYALVAGGAIMAGLLARRALRGLVVGLIALAIFGATLSQLDFFQEAQAVFLQRWQNAQASDAADGGIGGILANRIGGSMLAAIEMAWSSEPLGMGIGLATNVGAMRATGQKGFVIAEGAWPAIIGELGPLLGFALILWRVMLAVQLMMLAVVQALRNNPLPLILSGIALQGLVIGQTSQPTALGFLVVCTGLLLASCNPSSVEPSATMEALEGGPHDRSF
jgi:hypothetical protein